MLTLVRKSLYLLKREKLLRWLLVIALAIVVTGVEAAGALLIFVLLGLVAAPNTPIELPVLGDIRNLQGGLTHEAFVTWIAGGVAVFFLLRGLLLIAQVYVSDRLAHNAGARLSIRLVSSYLSMPYVLHLRRNSAELIRNAYESARAVTAEVFIPAVRLLSGLALAGGLLIVLFYAAPLASAAAIAILGILVLLLLRVVQPRLKALGRKRQRLSKESLKVLQQSLHGIREVTLFGRAPFFLREYARRQRAAARVSYLSRVAQEVPRVLIETTLVALIAVFFIITITLEGTPGEGLPVLGLFAYSALRIQPAVQMIVRALNSIRFAGAAIDNIYRDLRLVEDAESPNPSTDRSAPPSEEHLMHSIQLEAVEFRYTEDGRPALQEIDLVIRPGESVGIVGPTGGGKSTLVDVITGLLEPTSGRVLIDDVDLRQCTVEWQRGLGVVSQAVFLLDDTLRRNIALGIADRDIDEDRVRDAVELAQLSQFVDSLQQGLETIVGERGVRLSGGQRQRVAIARALYRDPAVLIFDEGTSALDNTTEAEFIGALARLKGRRTIIMVAHRLTTVRQCDHIVLVEGSRIADIGPFDELAARNPSFSQMSGSVSARDE